MTKDKSRIQSCVDHINTAVDVDPWAKELVAEMGKEILKAQLSKEDATSDLQQTCNQLATDCISRQAVIDALNEMKIYRPLDSDRYVISDCLNRIVNLPSAQPYTDEQIQRMQNMEQAQLDKAFELGREDAKPKWIPCSDKAPSEAQECWITAKDGTVCQGMFTRRYGERRDSGFICNGFGFAWLNAVAAWMPYEMPEPYQEEGE